jgi:hypothetical protein
MKAVKRQQARNLYFETHMSQAEIARLLDIDRTTMQNWMNEGNWRQLKKSANHMPSKLTEQFYFMMANYHHEILSRAHQPYPLTHELDYIRRMTLCIRNMNARQGVNESIESFSHLADILSYKDPELAGRVRPHIQTYMRDRADFRIAENLPEGYTCDPRLGEMFDYEIRPYDDNEQPDSSAEPGNQPLHPMAPGSGNAVDVNSAENTLLANPDSVLYSNKAA